MQDTKFRGDNFTLKVNIRTNLKQLGNDKESDRYRVLFGEHFYESVSYASVERLRQRVRKGHLDSWLWR